MNYKWRRSLKDSKIPIHLYVLSSLCFVLEVGFYHWSMTVLASNFWIKFNFECNQGNHKGVKNIQRDSGLLRDEVTIMYEVSLVKKSLLNFLWSDNTWVRLLDNIYMIYCSWDKEYKVCHGKILHGHPRFAQYCKFLTFFIHNLLCISFLISFHNCQLQLQWSWIVVVQLMLMRNS